MNRALFEALMKAFLLHQGFVAVAWDHHNAFTFFTDQGAEWDTDEFESGTVSREFLETMIGIIEDVEEDMDGWELRLEDELTEV